MSFKNTKFYFSSNKIIRFIWLRRCNCNLTLETILIKDNDDKNIDNIYRNENRLKWIERWIQIFQKYWFTNKMNAFQSWMHFYSFIGIGAYPYAFQSKNNVSFFCAFWIHFNSKFWIGNAVFQSNCIQLNLIESNWIQLNSKKYSYWKYIRIEKNFNPF